MHRVQGNKDTARIECVNPVKNKWRIRWDYQLRQDGTTDFMEAEFTHKPSVEEVRARFPELRIVGLSTHNPAQARAAIAQSPDYIGVGPVWATPTKDIPDPTLGVETAVAMAKSVPFPAVCIGGIDFERLPGLLKAGAKNYSVVRAVCASDDLQGRILRAHLGDGHVVLSHVHAVRPDFRRNGRIVVHDEERVRSRRHGANFPRHRDDLLARTVLHPQLDDLHARLHRSLRTLDVSDLRVRHHQIKTEILHHIRLSQFL